MTHIVQGDLLEDWTHADYSATALKTEKASRKIVVAKRAARPAKKIQVSKKAARSAPNR